MNNAGKCQQNGNCGNDAIVRNVAATNQTVAQSSWTDISQGFFGPGQVAGIYPSGGHTNLTVYALTSSNSIINYPPGRGPGQLWKGQSTNQAPISSWTLAMGTAPNNNLIQAYNIFVNPFDPNELYAVDLGDKTIKTSRDGGQSWDAIAKLKDIATNNGEFDFACASSSGAPSSAYRDKDIFGNQCPLTDMYFSREAPDIRVATLYPGGVAFSNDGGLTWTSLDINSADPSMQPIELPHSAFYDHRTSTLCLPPSGFTVSRRPGGGVLWRLHMCRQFSRPAHWHLQSAPRLQSSRSGVLYGRRVLRAELRIPAAWHSTPLRNATVVVKRAGRPDTVFSDREVQAR